MHRKLAGRPGHHQDSHPELNNAYRFEQVFVNKLGAFVDQNALVKPQKSMEDSKLPKAAGSKHNNMFRFEA